MAHSPDPDHLETRLEILAEMLTKAIAEVNNVMALIRGQATPPRGVRPLSLDPEEELHDDL